MSEPETRSLTDDWLARLAQTPDVYVQKLDVAHATVELVQLSAAHYRAASFLDDRLLGAVTARVSLPLARVWQAVTQVSCAQPRHFIFHTGHVGSTLISRLIEVISPVLCLREPLPLRTLAEFHDTLGSATAPSCRLQFDQALQLCLRLWSRGYVHTRAVVVKATSSAGRIAGPLLQGDAAARAIYLNVRAEVYLATLLAGENSAQDLRQHAAERSRRLQLRLVVPVVRTSSIGELAAMSWLTETWSQDEALRAFPERALAVDFGAFLADLAHGIGAIVDHLAIAVDERELAAISAHPVLRRYSKAVEYEYSPQLRQQVLADSRSRNRDEIANGMRWLQCLARSESNVAALLYKYGG
jgi:hypothetical protein